MKLIADRDGVDIIISPAYGDGGIQANLDFNYGLTKLAEQDDKAKTWDLRLYDDRVLIGRVKFAAFQFLADGVARRTISLDFIELEPRFRGRKKSYDVVEFVLARVKQDCDRDWGVINAAPVLFIEKKNLKAVPKAQHSGVFNFLKKIGEKILGVESKPVQVPDHDLVATAIGDDISLQLIEGHLSRSSALTV